MPAATKITLSTAACWHSKTFYRASLRRNSLKKVSWHVFTPKIFQLRAAKLASVNKILSMKSSTMCQTLLKSSRLLIEERNSKSSATIRCSDKVLLKLEMNLLALGMLYWRKMALLVLRNKICSENSSKGLSTLTWSMQWLRVSQSDRKLSFKSTRERKMSKRRKKKKARQMMLNQLLSLQTQWVLKKRWRRKKRQRRMMSRRE